jgi:fibronectin type 3 domain-containing protein
MNNDDIIQNDETSRALWNHYAACPVKCRPNEMFTLRKLKPALFFFLFLHLPVWAIMSLSGCGGSENILPAAILTSGEVTLMWDNVPGAAAYNVYLSTSPGVTVLNSYKIANATNPITITDLEPGITYFFVVTVEDDSGQSRKSKELSYTVDNTKVSIHFGDILSLSAPDAAVSEFENAPQASPSEPKTEPAAKVSISETRDVTLAWDDVPNATSYNIYWSDKPGVTKKNGIKISNVKNPHTITGLKKGEKYYFAVTAVNASGESKESEEFSFTVGQ